MKNNLYKKWWFWLVVIILIIAVFFIFNYKNLEKSYIKNKISEANYCQTESDCELVGSKCPFGCYIYANKKEADRIKGLVEGYESRCIYSCIQSQGVKCVENKCQSIIEINQTYTNNEYGFSFKYPRNVTVYEKGEKEFYPRLEDKLVAWGETDETYDNNVIHNSNTPYRITILEGKHPSEHEDYDQFTSIKTKDNKSFTVRYRGPISATDPISEVKNAYEKISESFEIN